MARKQSTPTAGSAKLVPSVSSFDFLEGAFAAAQRARAIGLAVAAASIATLTVLAMMGAGGLMAKKASEAELAATREQNTVALAELAKIDNAGGLSADQLTAHVLERERALEVAIGSEIDVVGFIADLRAATPAGVEITSITFSDVPTGVVNAAPVAEDGTGADGSVPTATPTPAPSTSELGSLEVKGTVTSFALIGAWAQSVGTVRGLSGVNPTWSGGGDAIATTLTATITDAGLSRRARGLKSGGGR